MLHMRIHTKYMNPSCLCITNYPDGIWWKSWYLLKVLKPYTVYFHVHHSCVLECYCVQLTWFERSCFNFVVEDVELQLKLYSVSVPFVGLYILWKTIRCYELNDTTHFRLFFISWAVNLTTPLFLCKDREHFHTAFSQTYHFVFTHPCLYSTLVHLTYTWRQAWETYTMQLTNSRHVLAST